MSYIISSHHLAGKGSVKSFSGWFFDSEVWQSFNHPSRSSETHCGLISLVDIDCALCPEKLEFLLAKDIGWVFDAIVIELAGI